MRDTYKSLKPPFLAFPTFRTPVVPRRYRGLIGNFCVFLPICMAPIGRASTTSADECLCGTDTVLYMVASRSRSVCLLRSRSVCLLHHTHCTVLHCTTPSTLYVILYSRPQCKLFKTKAGWSRTPALLANYSDGALCKGRVLYGAMFFTSLSPVAHYGLSS